VSVRSLLLEWSWARLEKRALAAHERDVEQSLAELVRTRSQVHHVDTIAERIGLARLVMADQSVLLVGLTPHGIAAARELAAAAGDLLLTESGRYNRAPFVVVTARTFERTMLAAQVRIVRSGGGGGDPHESPQPTDPMSRVSSGPV
jgi:hypothetical protein